MKKWQLDRFFWVGILLLTLLLFRNPFSGANTISDLEPWPDTIHYLNPAQSLTRGQGLKITYQGRSINSNVPPLYSLFLAPLIGLFKDIRVFYFANLILVFISTTLFYQIILAAVRNKLVRLLIFFSFITSTIIYWYPQVAMAENLLITLFLFSVWLLLKPLTTKKLILIGFLAASFYGTKYTALALSGSFLLINLIKIQQTKGLSRQKFYWGGLLLATGLAGFVILSWIEYTSKGSSVLSETLGHLIGLSSLVTISSPQVSSLHPSSADFSRSYLSDNLILYFFGLVGGQIPIAGKYLSLIPSLVGFTGLVGLILNPLIDRRDWSKNLVNLYLLLLGLLTIFSISFFITSDGRYIFALIPTLILSAGIFVDWLVTFLHQQKRSIYGSLIILIVFVGALLPVINPLKNQLEINFQTGEKALNYETVQGFNDYFAQNSFSQKPVVISTLPSYFIDFYSNHKYEVLPLSPMQYFSNTPLESWGIKKGIKFMDVYNQKLAQGTPLFISSYRTKGYFYNTDLEQIRSQFKLIKVKDGCQNQCNLYQLNRE